MPTGISFNFALDVFSSTFGTFDLVNKLAVGTLAVGMLLEHGI